MPRKLPFICSTMKIRLGGACWAACILLSLSARAQDAAHNGYVFPVPGSNGLTGTFMELRGGHFHYGLDIRTYERTGLPVVAVQDGYISRVRVSHAGYGKIIFVQHADGNSTGYGHVERFMPAVEQYIYEQQRKNQQFDLEVFPKAELFPVRKGDTIAWSGNVGASSGPHLHYEVRNKNEEVLNPLAWHTQTVKDGLAPFLSKIAFEPMDAASRVMGRFEKYVITPQNSEHQYYHAPVVEVQGRIGVEYMGYDRLFGSRNWNGVYSAQLFLDDSLIFSFAMDLFAFDETRYVLQFVDYKYQRENGVQLQKCYVDDNNRLRIYRGVKNRGIIELTDTAVHRLRLAVADLHGNKAEFTGRLRRAAAKLPAAAAPARTVATYETRRGMLVLKSPVPADSTQRAITLTYADSSRKTVYPAYYENGTAVTLLPLNGTVPAQAFAKHWGKPLQFGIGAVVRPNGSATIAYGEKGKGDFAADFAPDAVFTTTAVPFSVQPGTTPQVCSALYSVGNPSDAVFKGFRLKINYVPGSKTVAFLPQQIVLVQVTGPGKYTRAGNDYRIGNDWFTYVTAFGDYCLVADIYPPTVRPVNYRADVPIAANTPYLKFDLEDDIAGVHPYKIFVKLDGTWMLPEYYNYSGNLFCTFRTPPAPGPHKLEISVTDYAGNTTSKTFPFTVK
jgi:hypothetical protein